MAKRKRSEQSASRRMVAHHEAAHAVAAFRNGFPCEVCTIKRRGHLAGQVLYEGALNDASDLRRALIVDLAGYCAELKIGAVEQVAKSGAAADFQQAQSKLLRLADTTEAAAIEQAFAFVQAPHNWKAIELIAAELIVRHTLDGEELAILLLMADGALGPNELREYREGI